jgi:hypothetical protein
MRRLERMQPSSPTSPTSFAGVDLHERRSRTLPLLWPPAISSRLFHNPVFWTLPQAAVSGGLHDVEVATAGVGQHLVGSRSLVPPVRSLKRGPPPPPATPYLQAPRENRPTHSMNMGVDQIAPVVISGDPII